MAARCAQVAPGHKRYTGAGVGQSSLPGRDGPKDDPDTAAVLAPHPRGAKIGGSLHSVVVGHPETYDAPGFGAIHRRLW